MKIEIGESLFYSWLRHIKNCRIVQTNWKTSSTWNPPYNEKELDNLYEKAKKNFKDLFKQARSTFLKQAEIDVIGMGKNNELYAIDVAFHENGCNYKEKDKTIAKKIIRSAFCLYGYFNSKKGNIIFATPKFGNTQLEKVQKRVSEINEFLKKNKFNFNIEIICNEDFYNKVLIPVIEQSKNNTDTSELFMRSYVLYNLFQNKKETSSKNPYKKQKNNIFTQTNNKESEKIGKIVQSRLFSLLETNKIKKKELYDFQKKSYSQSIFGISYPLLTKTKKDRYYVNPIKINGTNYFICREWTKKHRVKLEKYLKDHSA